MEVACPLCQVPNRILMPAGAETLLVKCCQCQRDFEAQASAPAAPAPMYAPPQQASAPPQQASAPPQQASATPEQAPAPQAQPPADVSQQPYSQPGQTAQPPAQPLMTPHYAQPAAPQPVVPVMATPVGMPPQHQVMPTGRVLSLPSTPVRCTCTECGRVIVTAVRHEMGLGSWAVCAGVCCFGAGALSWLGLLPCCLTECQDAHHTCPSCNSPLGVKKFIC